MALLRTRDKEMIIMILKERRKLIKEVILQLRNRYKDFVLEAPEDVSKSTCLLVDDLLFVLIYPVYYNGGGCTKENYLSLHIMNKVYDKQTQKLEHVNAAGYSSMTVQSSEEAMNYLDKVTSLKVESVNRYHENILNHWYPSYSLKLKEEEVNA